MSRPKLRPAYPYFGSKAAVADRIWEALGVDVANFVDPMCGSASVLLARPHAGKIETVNDAHGMIPNFLRAIKHDPDAVAAHAAWPVSELDMHARHDWLNDQGDEAFAEKLRSDPDFYDAQIAGWWVWGASIWIGSGWCDGKTGHLGGKKKNGGMGINRPSLTLPHLVGPHNHRKLPHLVGKGQADAPGPQGAGVGYGRGIFATGRREDLLGYFQALADRLARVRITCGDWRRVVTPAVTISHGLTAVLLDPPYSAPRSAKLYAKDSATIAADVRAWALEHGDDARYRVALCGYENEHEMPSSWRCLAWKTNGGYGNQDRENANAAKERIWFSPYCLGGSRCDGPLFAHVAATENAP